ncbi:hypothetical protein EDC04DRAFT_3002799 [Pisolithus marmoratus]|nr:hypothetical protein EDC04DRAFT_3002799 [Pisolithus marmoratus]
MAHKRMNDALPSGRSPAKKQRLACEASLPYPSLSRSPLKVPTIQRPSQVLTFSHNSDHVLEFNDSALRYYIEPPHGADLAFHYEKSVMRPAERGRLDSLLTTWSRFKKDLHASNPSSSAVNVPDVNAATAMSLPDSQDAPGWGGDVNTNVQWCSVVKTKLADRRIIMGGEVDCVRGTYSGKTDNYVELKTSLLIRNRSDEARFEKKLLKFYLQSFLLGVPSFKTVEIPRLVRGKPGAWDPSICLEWGDRQQVQSGSGGKYGVCALSRKWASLPVMLDEAEVAEVVNGEDRVGVPYLGGTGRNQFTTPRLNVEWTDSSTTRTNSTDLLSGWRILTSARCHVMVPLWCHHLTGTTGVLASEVLPSYFITPPE